MPPTKDEIRASYPDKTNPRWIACHIALGHLPEVWEFTVWMGEKWAEFARLACGGSCKHARDLEIAHGINRTHAAFGKWLETGEVEKLPPYYKV